MLILGKLGQHCVQGKRPLSNLVQEDDNAIWRKVFNAVDVIQQRSVLAIMEVVFCLPKADRLFQVYFADLS